MVRRGGAPHPETVFARVGNERVALGGVAGDAVERAVTILLVATPCCSSAEFIASLTMISWLIGTAAIRSTSRSVRASRSLGSGASIASPHSAASAPVMQSPVAEGVSRAGRLVGVPTSRRRGTPHTRVGG